MIASRRQQVQQEIQNGLTVWRKEKLAAFDEASLVWLAAVPAWTERLAADARFPFATFKSLEEFLVQAEQDGICVRDGGERTKELVLPSVRAMMALWPRLDDPAKVRVASVLRQRAEMLPPGPEQRRVIRETEPLIAGSGSGFQETIRRLFGSSSGPNESSSTGALDLLQNALSDLKESGGRALSVRLVQSAVRLAGPQATTMLLSALSELEPASALRAMAPLMTLLQSQPGIREFIQNIARSVDPEDLAGLYLYVAANSQGELRANLQNQAIAATRSIQDPAARVLAWIDAVPVLDDGLKGTALQEALAAAMSTEPGSRRVQMLASVLPLLPPDGADPTINDVVALAQQLSEPSQRTGALAAAARALAARGDVQGAVDLAALATEPGVRVQILLEALPGNEKLTEFVRLAISGTTQPQLEQLLANLSPEAGRAVATALPAVVIRAVGSAASAGSSAVSARIASFLPDRERTSVTDVLLDRIQLLAALSDRLDAICQVAAYLPDSVLPKAWDIAAQFAAAPAFAAVETLRVHMLEHARNQRNTTFVREQAQAAGAAIMKAAKSGSDLPAATARWAAIAELVGNTFQASGLLITQIRAAVERGHPSEALDILNIAVPLSRVVGAELEPAIAMGRQAIQLAYRQAADERQLRRYLPREELDRAFTELIDASGGRWAVHYLGMGGVGKTMLLRHIAARLAVNNGVKLPTTRIDFDHIDPDFPVRKPGELLVSLAEELRFYGGSDQEARYIDFIRELTAVHGLLSGEPPPGEPLHNIERPEFTLLLKKFAALLAGLPKPVIFILDTCEELAKLEPAGYILPSVEATFRILEKLQEDRDVDIRVVFAGRRLLARAGDGPPNPPVGSPPQYRWQAQPGSLSERNKLLPEAKPYLRLHVIRGFDESETDRFFLNIAQVDPGRDRKEAILQASRETGDSAEILWDGLPEATDTKCARFNPFDVSLYAEWVREKPDVSAATIGSRETDPYVQVRIVDRITDEAVRNALPAAVLLRRFDLDMLRPMTHDGEELRRIYRELGGLEWIDYQQNALQVHTNLLDRVERYFRHSSRRYLLDRVRETLGPALAEQVREALATADPFAGLSVAKIDATLRLVPAAEAAAIWDRIDRTVAVHGNWPWAANVCRYLVAEHNAAGSDDSPLRAAVRATMAAAALHTSRPDPTTLTRWWDEIARTASLHPSPILGQWLALRAELARGSVTWSQLRAIDGMRSDPWLYEQLAASAIASLQRRPSDDEALAAHAFSSQESGLPLEIRSAAACMLSPFPSLRELAAQAGTAPTLQRWADWNAPHLVRDRVRIEILRPGRQEVSNDELDQWSADAAAILDNVDSERLLARILQLRLDSGVPALPELGTHPIYDAERKPACQAHLNAPVLFAVLAETALAAGDSTSADRFLQTSIKEQDAEAATAARLGRARLSRIMRRSDSLAVTREALAIEHPGCTAFHRWWVTQTALNTEDTIKLVDAAERQVAGGWHRADGTLDPHSALDALELDLLGRRIGRQTNHSEPLLAELNDLNGSYDERVRIRMAALRGGDYPQVAGSERRSAEMTQAEGELLALRLPALAVPVFRRTAVKFRLGEDPFGEFRAMACKGFAEMAQGHFGVNDNFVPIPDAYLRCRERLPGLPSWDSVIAGAGHPWPDWAVRIIRLKAWASNSNQEILTTLALGVQRQLYGAVPQFELSVAATPKPTEESAAEPSLAVKISGGIIVALFIAGVLGGAWWLWRHATADNLGIVGAVVGGAALIAADIWLLSRYVFPRMARAIYRMFRPKLYIHRSGANRVSISLESGPPQRSLGRLLSWPRLGTLETTLPIPTSGGYSQAGDGLVALVKENRLLRLLRNQPLFSRIPIMAVVERELAKYPWEIPLHLALRRGTFGEKLQIVRPGDAVSPPAGIQSWGEAGVGLWCRPGLAPLIESAWSRMPGGIENDFERPPQANAVKPLRVVHLIGTVTRTSAGPQFSIGRPAQPELPLSVDISKLPQNAFPQNAAIVVVQEEPAERVRRLDVDRDQTAETRAWASQLFYNGVQTVLLIPALPLALAGTLTDVMARRFRQNTPPTLYQLLDLVTDLQNRVKSFKQPAAQAGTPDFRGGMAKTEFEQALRELCLEITLFTRSPEAELVNRFTGFSTS